MIKNLRLWLPLVALAAAGCMKEPELKADFGPEVTSAEFSSKLSEIEGPDPYTIKKDEYAYFIRSTVLQDQVYQLDKRWAYTVTNKTEDANDHIFSFVKETREYVGDQEKISQNQSEVRLTKRSSNTSSLKLSQLQFRPTETRTAPIVQMSTLTPFAYRPASTEKVTFHNLKLEKTYVPVPDFVKQRANCGGLSSEKCRGALKAFVMTFDQVQWTGNEGQRFSVLWIFSPDIPYFGSTMFPSPAGVLKSCGTTQVPYEGQRVKVTQCDEIKDFTFGSD
ncbi:MAG: hypothetical protein KF767_10600 [Bdellovibrionaceae bacterium]|nr:hypothetical protein [Pseudobdellovibrionaceae bacterium]